MVLSYYACTLVLLTGFSSVGNAQNDVTFPTDTEIKLVLTQLDRAIQLYKPVIEQKAVYFGGSGTDAIVRDREVVSALETAVRTFKEKPQGFNSPLGFAFFEWIDDAGRNAALCAGELSTQAMSQVLAGNAEQARTILGIAKSCGDMSALIYTVSENAGSLYQRYVAAEQKLAQQAAEVAQKCINNLNKNGAPSKR